MHELIGELPTRSEEFRSRWAAHNVQPPCSGAKDYHHNLAGDLTLAFESLEMAAAPGLTSSSEERLRLLASWAASQVAISRLRTDARPTERNRVNHPSLREPAHPFEPRFVVRAYRRLKVLTCSA